MRGVCAALIFAGISTNALAFDGPPCVSHTNRHYTEALAKRLTLNGVPYTMHRERGICYAAERQAEVSRAGREVDNYFYEVAGLLKNSCEEKALVAWAAAEKLPFEVNDTTDSAGKFAGRMLNIYSLTPQDVTENREKLRLAAGRMECK